MEEEKGREIPYFYSRMSNFFNMVFFSFADVRAQFVFQYALNETQRIGSVFSNVYYVSLQGREILMKMLEVFVRKFQTIAKHHIPAILEKW